MSQGVRKSLIYNVRKPEQDQSAIIRPIWQHANERERRLFDNPNGSVDAKSHQTRREKKWMDGRDKMCLEGKFTDVDEVMAPRKPGRAQVPHWHDST